MRISGSGNGAVLLLLGLLVACAPGAAAEPKPSVTIAVALAESYDQRIRPFLQQHCVVCHSGEKPKGDLRLDRVSADFATDADRKQWLHLLERVQTGEMPPKAKPRLLRC